MAVSTSKKSTQTSRTASSTEKVNQILWPFPPMSPTGRRSRISGRADIMRGDVLESLDGDHDYLLVIDRIDIGGTMCYLLYSAAGERFVVWTMGEIVYDDNDTTPQRIKYGRTEYAHHTDIVNETDDGPLASTTLINDTDWPNSAYRSWYPYADPPSLISPASPSAPDRIAVSSPSQSNKDSKDTTQPHSSCTSSKPAAEDIRNKLISGDALEQLTRLPDNVVTTWVTSPPYPGQQRDYDCDEQMATGSPEEYLAQLLAIIDEAFRATHPHGTGWLVVDDTISNGAYRGVPDRLVGLLREYGYKIIHNGPFVKTDRGAPDPAPSRFSHDHERVLGIAQQNDYHFDREALDNDSDVLESPTHSHSKHQPSSDILDGVNHDAPFPAELIDPIVKATTPDETCANCGHPYRHVYEVTDIYDLKPNRHRERVQNHIENSDDFTREHAWACRKVGLSDTGQLSRTENGPEESNKTARQLYKEIEQDDFDFPQSYRRQFASYVRKHRTDTQQLCNCDTTETKPAIVLDPFVGLGTTPCVAQRHGADYFGIDLNEDYIAAAQRRLANGIDTSLTNFTR